MPRTSEIEHERLCAEARRREIQRPPSRPLRGECCERGCDPCIWDYYERALARWRTRHRASATEEAPES